MSAVSDTTVTSTPVDRPAKRAHPETILRVKELCKHFPQRKPGIIPRADAPVRAVDGITFDIGRGETVGLVGESGCGKSTTLRMLAGLEEINSGDVYIGDRNVTDVPPKDRDIAMVFQNYALYPHMTVAENMGFALKIAGVNKEERANRVLEAAKLLDLEPYLGRKPKALSGGQRQRVAMGRAIVRQPQVFLMDEPLSNLDAKLRVQTRTQIASLQRRLGVTTVYVTHDQTEALTMGDRIAVLKDGVLQQIGTPRDLYENPMTTFVANFLGQSNLLTGTVSRRTGDGVVVEVRGRLIELPADRVHAEGPAVHVGVRPEKIQILPGGTGATANQNTVAATLRSAVFAGVSFQYFFQTKEGREMSAFDRNGSGAAVARPGEAVRLAWAPEHTFVIPFEDEAEPQDLSQGIPVGEA